MVLEIDRLLKQRFVTYQSYHHEENFLKCYRLRTFLPLVALIQDAQTISTQYDFFL